jgi:uncharacterized protein YtpQ (UPF0354 family)
VNWNELQTAIAYLKASVTTDDENVDLILNHEDSPVIYPINENLLVTFLVDQSTHYEYVLNRHLEQANVSIQTLVDIGLNNLRKMVVERGVEVRDYQGIHSLFFDGNFEASLLLVDELWDEWLSHLVETGYVVTIPSRDVIAFCERTSREGISQLQAVSDRVQQSHPDHPLSSNLYIRQEGKWVSYSP